MNYSKQDISDQTGFDQGHKFESIEQIREYFTETNISEMFPGENIVSQEELNQMADTIIDNLWHCSSKMKAVSLAREIVSQMNDDDKLNFEKESWRDGIGHIIAGSDESYWNCDDDLILDEIERILEPIYMNPCTGSTGTYDEWWYENESGEQVNAVDLHEVVQVEKDKNGNWVDVDNKQK